MQRKWLETAHIISFRNCRRVAFCDFVSFIRKESELANDPTYSPGALSKATDKRAPKNEKFKAPRESFISKVTSFATESNNQDIRDDSKEKLLCVYCSKDHDIDCCNEFLANSPYHRKMFVVSKRLCFGCYSSEHCLSNCQQKRVRQQKSVDELILQHCMVHINSKSEIRAPRNHLCQQVAKKSVIAAQKLAKYALVLQFVYFRSFIFSYLFHALDHCQVRNYQHFRVRV